MPRLSFYGWIRLFKKNRFEGVYSEFVKENKSHQDIFPPKAVLVLEK